MSDKARKFDVEGKGTMPETSEWMGWWAGHDIDQGPSNFFLKDFRLDLATGRVESTGEDEENG